MLCSIVGAGGINKGRNADIQANLFTYIITARLHIIMFLANNFSVKCDKNYLSNLNIDRSHLEVVTVRIDL